MTALSLFTFSNPRPAQGQTSEADAVHAFGTVSKINVLGQAVLISEYNWETNEPVDVQYGFNRLTIKKHNMASLDELKPGDEIEFKWYLFGPNKLKMIFEISKGPMPEEPINMDFNFNLETEPAAQDDASMQPVEVKEGVDVMAPEVVKSADESPVVEGSQAPQAVPVTDSPAAAQEALPVEPAAAVE